MKKTAQKLVLTLAWLALPMLGQAQLTYSTNGGAITITGYTSPPAGLDLVIPPTINDLPVTSIGDSAFLRISLYSASIPEGVTNIGFQAFDDSGVSIANIPDTVTTIGDDAFFQCDLKIIALPFSVTNIMGGDSFRGCSLLTNITVDPSNPAYSSLNGVLFDKAQATLLQFPGGITGSYTIPDTVTSILAFDGNSGLTNVTIPGSVTNIANDAFIGAVGLHSLTIPNSVTSIGSQAFENCSSLTNLIIGNGVASIESEVFQGCTSLTNLTIGNAVTSIGASAFAGCLNLTNLIIGDGVTNIESSAFTSSSKLKTIYFRGNAPFPTNDSTVFSPAVSVGGTIYYLPGATGWGAKFDNVRSVLWNPQANTLGSAGGQFGFDITGPANAVILVEACTNLANPVWLPIATKTLSTSGTSTFTDPSSAAFPIRYYRFSTP